MLGSEALTLLKQRMQRNVTGTVNDAWYASELAQVQTRLERGATIPWFLVSERAYEDMKVADERVKVPDRFIREPDQEMMQVEDLQTGTKYDLTKHLYEDIRLRFPLEEIGRPQQYALVGEYFRCRPIPDRIGYRLWMVYYQTDAAFNLAEENQWLKYYPDLLIAEAGIVIAGGQQNPSAQIFVDMRTTERTRMQTDNIAREQQNLDPNPED